MQQNLFNYRERPGHNNKLALPTDTTLGVDCLLRGVTIDSSFGGPAVHFQIFRRLFVDKYKWIDDQMYQENFALCQALPGPGSTKMLYCINVIHAGFLPGIVSFFVWSLPAAIGAYGLAVGIAQVNERLPDPVYALLSGLNAATVGIIVLAGVQLSQKAITDKLSRILVFFGATAGMLYNALWYFPVLMVVGGCSTIIWDRRWLQNLVKRFRTVHRRVPATVQDVEASESATELRETTTAETSEQRRKTPSTRSGDNTDSTPQSASNEAQATGNDRLQRPEERERIVPDALQMRVFSWKLGVTIFACFFITFIVTMTLRGVLSNRPRGFSLFANMYLAGTIIFGGGPVVIPLLREYVVAEGWVSPRDFLLGLAIIQAFPGPNFNFAVYLGALAAKGTSLPLAAGAVIGFIGIFTPGLVLHTGTMGVWHTLRGYRWFTSCLRGVNATAVGLVYTAVFRLWRIGYINGENQEGTSLETDPWWVVITATSFVGGMWFKLQAPVAILLGGTMGMVWYGIVRA
ncbi:hypothetical protein GJ744_004392 [Endocarpon pusillum]|uniref:Chromate ion transporter n=1 Tax=Endocarpon pusillum TaxID=364733 RepID=A0A8H7ATH7_9EURO|nr:hypothetical protein GJ744_004392 [Endocarpon pusillum]